MTTSSGPGAATARTIRASFATHTVSDDDGIAIEHEPVSYALVFDAAVPFPETFAPSIGLYSGDYCQGGWGADGYGWGGFADGWGTDYGGWGWGGYPTWVGPNISLGATTETGSLEVSESYNRLDADDVDSVYDNHTNVLDVSGQYEFDYSNTCGSGGYSGGGTGDWAFDHSETLRDAGSYTGDEDGETDDFADPVRDYHGSDSGDYENWWSAWWAPNKDCCTSTTTTVTTTGAGGSDMPSGPDSGEPEDSDPATWDPLPLGGLPGEMYGPGINEEVLASPEECDCCGWSEGGDSKWGGSDTYATEEDVLSDTWGSYWGWSTSFTNCHTSGSAGDSETSSIVNLNALCSAVRVR